VLQPLVVSALIDEIPVTKIRDGERASPSACTHRSEMYDSSEPLSKSTRQVVCDPVAFLTNTRAVGNALFRSPCGCVAVVDPLQKDSAVVATCARAIWLMVTVASSGALGMCLSSSRECVAATAACEPRISACSREW